MLDEVRALFNLRQLTAAPITHELTQQLPVLAPHTFAQMPLFASDKHLMEYSSCKQGSKSY
jgi:hypothetical protein